MKSAVESLESETTVVKKSVKKSVKTSKTTSKKKTISTTESSSITSSKAESFENSFSNGSIEVVEQHHVQEHQSTVHQESLTSSRSIDSSSGKETVEAIKESEGKPPLENGEKKKLNGKKKVKKSKKSDEKENISVVSQNFDSSIQILVISFPRFPFNTSKCHVLLLYLFLLRNHFVFLLLHPVGCLVVLFHSDGMLSSFHFALLDAR